ncbi:hypothetical protein LVY65_07315 [Sphingomonas sp. G124]|uniref:Uncharacterized protein n=1 Tax=Sphingomonas cremea TaxID=2904799 RepID=A0A9X1QMJ3_9SPHN|nr:hypothetical protein [Sphingomonas cremea]MCF2514872.1 hypothetical protein [Sphingomonas cremea]
MIGVEEFKQRLQADSLQELADEFLLADGAAHVTEDQFNLIRQKLADSYGLDDEAIKIIVTGSAKLGFSLIEKRDEDGNVRPRFRPFSVESDIDVAVLSPQIFDLVWFELSAFAANRPWFPLAHKKLGPYLVSGWLRPDHFPNSGALMNCRKWFPIFAGLSADIRFGRRKVRAGLFYSLEQLRQYQMRSLRDALSGADL